MANLVDDGRYYPALCADGHRPFLASLSGADGAVASPHCPQCGVESRIIPGAFYTAATRARFEGVVDVLYGTRVRREQVAGTLASLERCGADLGSVITALERVPQLRALAALAPRDERQLPGFVGLVLVLLPACTTPMESGKWLLIPTASAAPQTCPKTGSGG